MHSLRRAATRVSLASVFSPAAAPRTQSITLGIRSALALRCFSIATSRAFSRSVVLRNEKWPLDFGNRDDEHTKPPTATHCIFINNYPLGATEQDIGDAFARFGEIVKVDMPVRKAFCFVHFSNAESALQAVEKVNGTTWQGRRVTVAMSESSGQRPRMPFRRLQTQNDTADFSVPTTTLYVGNISFDATDDDLKRLFGGLENVKDVRIAVDKATGWPRGFAHVEFKTVQDAQNAMTIVQGQSINDRKLFTNFAPHKSSNFVRRLEDRQQVREQLLTEQEPAEQQPAEQQPAEQQQGEAVQAEEQSKQ